MKCIKFIVFLLKSQCFKCFLYIYFGVFSVFLLRTIFVFFVAHFPHDFSFLFPTILLIFAQRLGLFKRLQFPCYPTFICIAHRFLLTCYPTIVSNAYRLIWTLVTQWMVSNFLSVWLQFLLRFSHLTQCIFVVSFYSFVQWFLSFIHRYFLYNFSANLWVLDPYNFSCPISVNGMQPQRIYGYYIPAIFPLLCLYVWKLIDAGASPAHQGAFPKTSEPAW